MKKRALLEKFPKSTEWELETVQLRWRNKLGQWVFNQEYRPQTAIAWPIAAALMVGMLGLAVAQETESTGNSEMHTISGKVVDHKGNGVAGALVVGTDHRWDFSRTVISDQDGGFSIPANYPGQFGALDAYWGNLNTNFLKKESNILQLRENNPFACPVWGRVIDWEGKPVPNATVHGLGRNYQFKQHGIGDIEGPVESVTTDVSGLFVLPSTNFEVALYAEAGEQCSRLMMLPADRSFDPISLKIDQKFDDVLGTLGTRSDATPASGSRVHLLLGNGFGKERSATTNERGEFAFTRLPPGTAELWAQPRNDSENTDWVPVELNGFSRPRETLYIDSVPSVRARLISPEGKILADTKVYLAHDNQLFDRTTDNNGWFSFPYRSIGSSKFYIGLNAATLKHEYKQITVTPPQLNLGEVTLEPNPRIIGRVVDLSGNPIAATVSRHYDTPGYVSLHNPEVRCDAMGYFNFFVSAGTNPMEAIEITPPFPEGHQWINSWPGVRQVASYPFYKKVIPTLPLPTSSDDPLDLGTIVLEKSEYRELRGKVIDEQGRPAANVVVAMYFGSPDPKRWVPEYAKPIAEVSSGLLFETETAAKNEPRLATAHFVTISDDKGEWNMETYRPSEQDENAEIAYRNSFIGALPRNGLFGFINSVSWLDSVSAEKEWVIQISRSTGLNRFAGKVVDNEGNPVPGVTIHGFRDASFSVTTDDDGRFEAFSSSPTCLASATPPYGWLDKDRRKGHTLSSDNENIITIDRVLSLAQGNTEVAPVSER